MNDSLNLDFLDGWEWLGQILLLVALALIAAVVARQFFNFLERQTTRTSSVWDDALPEAARRPFFVALWLQVAVAALQFAAQALLNGLLADEVFATTRALIIIHGFAWFLVRLNTGIERRMLERFHADPAAEARMDPTTLHALVRVLRLVIIIVAVLITLPVLGVEVTAVLAFGGIGGIAVGFAAQDLLANFFGGLMIYLDRPFSIGDWIRSPDREFEGTVEKIGWRLTVVRTFDKRPLYVPNSVFNKLSLENPSRMSHRRIYETIGIRYQDAAKMDVIIEDIKTMLRGHEEIDTSQTMIVNFNSFAPSSLDFFVYTFTKTTNWVRFHEIKQDVLLRIVAIIHGHEADIAFPTTTIDGLPAVRPEPRPEPQPDSGPGEARDSE